MADLKSKKGTTLSKAAVDKLASEAETRLQPVQGQASTDRAGSPLLSEGESPRISYRVAPALFDRAKKKAKAEGRTVSEVAREARQKYVAG
jgi:hypothetical protein